MANPLVTAIGAQAQAALEKRNIDVTDVDVDSADERYTIEVPSEDISTSGIEIIVKGV